jgi:hypothetical protein
VVFVVRRELERDVHEAFGARLLTLMQVTYAYQDLDDLPSGFRAGPGRTAPWGTGHAVLAARRIVKGPFLVINADDFYGPESFRILTRHLMESEAAGAPNDHAMVGFRLRNTLSEHGSVSRGICAVDEEGYLSQITEQRALSQANVGAAAGSSDTGTRAFNGEETVSMNFWGFRPTIFAELERAFAAFLKSSASLDKSEFALPTALDELIAQRRARVRVLTSPDAWFGVTYAEDRAEVVRRVAELVRGGVYPTRLFD